MIRVFYDKNLKVLKTWKFKKEPFSAEEMKKRLGIQDCKYRDFDVEFSNAIISYELDSDLNLIPIEKKKEKKRQIAEIDKQLYDNDIKRIRAIAENDSLYLSIYNNIAVSLRAERKALTDGGE